jgi:hypothetical protein
MVTETLSSILMEEVNNCVGAVVGAVSLVDGDADGDAVTGGSVSLFVGAAVSLVGATDGCGVGASVGGLVSGTVGAIVSGTVGAFVGSSV